MEEIISFLAASMSSGAIGHYVSKGLKKIDSELPSLLQNEPDTKKLHDIIRFKAVEDEIKQLALDFNYSPSISNTSTNNVVNFSGGTNSGVVANNVEIKTSSKNVKVEAPQGSIASSLQHKNYTKYLIDRYHEFKKSELGAGSMNYAIFYNSIKRKFGAKWDMVPLSRFEELSVYLQKRIDDTVLGRNKKAKNSKSYSSFEEYLQKHLP
ncbi:hypothetical protein [Pseudoalteromonas rubra]|uniref:hypothetical protein n=1 Tax=Pseudoalteromonas rubra TaxID=43658 RepID=UPI000F769130|nr:hypothetical protein [Pseudoalteromonas rubra]